MKQIKISNETKDKLDKLKENNESYNNLVFRIIKENEQLKSDKQFLSEVIRKLLLSLIINREVEIPNEDDLIFILKELTKPLDKNE